MKHHLPLLEYNLFTPSPTGEGAGGRGFAFTTTREGGVSKGAYGSFNINSFCGDDPEAIAQNKLLLADRLDIPVSHIIMPHQVHETRTLLVDEDYLSLDADDLEGYDALITQVKGVCIGVSTADCTPILLYDAHRHACAAVHAGWRGTVKRIVEHCIREMGMAFGTEPQDLHAVIGPCISLRNFEVGDEVYDAFREAGFPMGRIARRYTKWHIDLPECNRLQMIGLGLREENIQLSGICTYDSCDHYFSARRLGINSGRLYTGIVI